MAAALNIEEVQTPAVQKHPTKRRIPTEPPTATSAITPSDIPSAVLPANAKGEDRSGRTIEAPSQPKPLPEPAATPSAVQAPQTPASYATRESPWDRRRRERCEAWAKLKNRILAGHGESDEAVEFAEQCGCPMSALEAYAKATWHHREQSEVARRAQADLDEQFTDRVKASIAVELARLDKLKHATLGRITSEHLINLSKLPTPLPDLIDHVSNLKAEADAGKAEATAREADLLAQITDRGQRRGLAQAALHKAQQQLKSIELEHPELFTSATPPWMPTD